MEYMDPTSRLRQAPYPVIGFADYVKNRLAELRSPIAPPPYAMPAEKEQLAAVSEYVSQNPYQFFETYNDHVNKTLTTGKTSMITRMSDPLLYTCMEDCCAALGFGSLAGYTYEPEEAGLVYNAYATGHMDMTWVMVSNVYRKQNLLTDLELTFLLGHELGHVAGLHTSARSILKLKPESIRSQEHTADRAGLLATVWRIARLEAGLSPTEMYHKALEAGKSLRHKQHILNNVASTGPWTRQSLEEKLAEPRYAIPEKKAGRKDTHPSAWERIRALEEYVRLTEFAECIHTLWGSAHPAALRLGEEAAHV